MTAIRNAIYTLLGLAVVLVIVLCLFAINTLATTNDVAQSVEEIVSGQTLNGESLSTQAEQSECVDRTTVAWMEQLTLALLEEPDSQAQADAVARLAPIAEDLRTINERCYQDNPLPATEPAETAPTETGTTTAEDGNDGRDGRDGRSIEGPPGAQGEPGADGVGVQGPAGPAGRDGADGKDSTVPGPPGQPGESIVGPEGPQGPQGFPGFDGSPPQSWTWTDMFGNTYECSDPDGDLRYSCPLVP